MSPTPVDQKPVWMRDDGTVQPRVNAAVRQAGMVKADWIREVIEFALRQNDPLFFAKRGKRISQRGK